MASGKALVESAKHRTRLKLPVVVNDGMQRWLQMQRAQALLQFQKAQATSDSAPGQVRVTGLLRFSTLQAGSEF